MTLFGLINFLFHKKDVIFYIPSSKSKTYRDRSIQSSCFRILSKEFQSMHVLFAQSKTESGETIEAIGWKSILWLKVQ